MNNMLHIELGAEKIISIFGFPITNTLIMSWVVVGFLAFLAYRTYKKLKAVPSFLQNILELTIDKLLDLMNGIFGSREKAERYFPIVATIFIFILLSNWLGIMPGIGSIGFVEESDHGKIFVPLFRSAASDINFTLALAIISIVATNIFGIVALGFWKHAKKFINFRGPIDFFIGILELISEIAKTVSFSFRLFGNVFAGEVLLVIMGVLAPYFIPMPFLILEIFVGFMQAFVFAMLTMVFISISVSHHDT